MIITVDKILAASPRSPYYEYYRSLQTYFKTVEGEPLIRVILRAGKKFDLMHAFWLVPAMDNPENLAFLMDLLDRRYSSKSELDCICYPVMDGIPRIAFSEKDWSKDHFLNYKEHRRYKNGYKFTKHPVTFLDSLADFVQAANDYLDTH